jgi:hypothetical protein
MGRVPEAPTRRLPARVFATDQEQLTSLTG